MTGKQLFLPQLLKQYQNVKLVHCNYHPISLTCIVLKDGADTCLKFNTIKMTLHIFKIDSMQNTVVKHN